MKELITAYLAADPGTRYAVRKLLEIPEKRDQLKPKENNIITADFQKEPLFCNRVKEIRESKGITREDLCKNAGISLKTLLGIEDGTSGNVHTKTAAKIAEALGISATELFYYKTVEREQ